MGGWSGFEKTPEGDTFVWAQAREARLSVRDRGDGDRLLRFRCWPFRWGGAGPQTLNLFLNDARIAALTLQDGPRVYSVPTPQAAWRRGANEIRLEFGYAEAPRDRVAGSGDPRTLAAAFDWLEIVPRLK